MIDDPRPSCGIIKLISPNGVRTMKFESVQDYQSQQESDFMFIRLSQHGPMEVSPDGEMRKIENG